jgi:hypothetical protein
MMCFHLIILSSAIFLDFSSSSEAWTFEGRDEDVRMLIVESGTLRGLILVCSSSYEVGF